MTFDLVIEDKVTGSVVNRAVLTFTVIGGRVAIDGQFEHPPTPSDLACVEEAIPQIGLKFTGDVIEFDGPVRRFNTQAEASASNRKYLGGGMG